MFEWPAMPLPQRQRMALYLTNAIEGFVLALVGVFVPVYFLQLGYSLRAVFAFLLLKHAAVLAGTYLAVWLAARLGFARTMLVRVPIAGLTLALIRALANHPIPLPVIAALDGLQVALYWIPLHCLFARAAAEGRVGTQVGRLSAGPQLARLVAPFAGGLITVWFGFGALFLVAILLLPLALIPLLFAPTVKPPAPVGGAASGRWLALHPKFSVVAALAEVGMMTERTLWPLFVFLALASVFAVGVVGSLAGLGTALFALLVGARTDRAGRLGLLKWGALLLGLTWLARLLVSGAGAIYLLTALAGFFVVLVAIPFATLSYDLARRQDIDTFVVAREIPFFVGRAALLGVAWLAAPHLEAAFIMSSLASLAMLWL